MVAAKTIKSRKCSLSLTLKTKNNNNEKRKQNKTKLTALGPHGHGSMPHRPFCFLLYFYKASLTFRGKKKVCDQMMVVIFSCLIKNMQKSLKKM